MAEFKHFQPIKDASVPALTPNFPLGAGQIDFANPKKNQAHFEELATSVGLGVIKGQILKNTFKFFQPNNAVSPPGADRRGHPFPKGVTDTSEMAVLGHNVFGFPVFSNLLIQGDSYQDNNGNTIGEFDDIRLDVVIMEMERENNLITTEIQGRNGTIIEYIGSKSVNVHVTGRILADVQGVYPFDKVNNLAKALYSNRALQVTSWFLAMRGVYHLVVKKDSIKQEEGSQEYQKFEFDAMADQPVILQLK